MADGKLIFDTKLDSSGLVSGLKTVFSVSAKAITAVSGALSAGAGAVVKIGSGFEAAMSTVSAVSGAAGEELEALREKAKEMGASTKFSATEAAEAMNYMAMAGWKTEDMLEGIEGIMNLAAASGEDLATTSDIVTDALTAFGLSAQDSTHFADILAAASSNANTNVSMMGETFKYVAPVAGALGFSAEDCATAIGLMANSGIKASQAGTSLRSILTRMSNPTKEVQSAMDALGVSVVNSDGSMKSLNEIMGDLRKGFAGLSEAEQAQMASAIGGQEAMSGLLAIVNASEEDFNKLQDSIYGCDGAAAAMAETMQDNLQGQLTILKSGLEGLAISLYECVQDPLKEIAKEAQGMVGQLQDAFNEGGLEGLVTALGDVLAQIVERLAGMAPDLISAATGLVSSFCDGLKNSPGVGDAAAGLIASLVTALISCAADLASAAFVLGMQLLDGLAQQLPEITAFALTCILTLSEGLVSGLPQLAGSAILIVRSLADALIEGIPLLLDGAVQLFGGILAALPVVIDSLLAALPDLITSIVDFLAGSVPQIVNAAVTLLYGLIDAIPQIIDAVVQNLPQIIDALVTGIVNAAPQILDAAVDLLMALVDAIPQVVTSVTRNLPRIITTIITSLGKAAPQLQKCALGLLGKLVEAIPEIAVSLVQALPQIIDALVTGLLGGIPALFEAAQALGGQLLEGIQGILAQAWEGILTFFLEQIPAFIESLVGWLAGIGESIGTWFSGLGEQIYTAVSGLIDTVLTFIAGLPERIAYWLGYILASIAQWGVDLITWAIENIPVFVESIVNFIAALPGRIAEWLGNVIAAVAQWGANMISRAVQTGSQFVQNVISFISGLPGRVQTWLTNTITNVLAFAANLKSRATEAGNGFITNIVNALTSLPGKMAEIGSNVVSGIWNGISAGWTWLVNQVKGLANSLLQGAKDALGIHSPSKKFRWIGEMCVEGMDEPLEEYNPYGTLRASMLAGERSFKNDFKAGFMAGRPAAVSTTSQVTNRQTVNIYQPVKTPSETARAIRLEQQYGLAGD